MANWLSRQIAAFRFESARAQHTRALETMMREHDNITKKTETLFENSIMKDEAHLVMVKDYWATKNKNGMTREDVLNDLNKKQGAAADRKAAAASEAAIGVNSATTNDTRFGRLVARLLGRSVSQERAANAEDKFGITGEKYGWDETKQSNLLKLQKMNALNQRNERNEKYVDKIDVSDKFDNKPKMQNSPKLNKNEPVKQKNAMEKS